MENTTGALCFDEYGRPVLLLKEEDSQARLTGVEALRSHILAARGVADKLKTSLGPRGMDKMLVTPEGEVVVTNDGATILDLMDPEHEVGKLMVSLAQTQDREVGDGTTGVVVLAGALLQEAASLLDKGVHPGRIADGYQAAARAAAEHLDTVAVKVSVSADDISWLLRVAKTALNSKVASKALEHLAEIAVSALTTTCDLFQEDPVMNVNSIVLRGKAGGNVEDSELITGVIIEGKSDLKSTLGNTQVAVFSGSAFQLPIIHTRTEFNLDLENYIELKSHVEELWMNGVLQLVQDSGAELVICAGTMDETINNLLSRNGIHVVENVAEIEMAAALVGAQVIEHASSLNGYKVGSVDRVRVIEESGKGTSLIALEKNHRSRIATIFVRGNNNALVEEVKRSVQDAICVVRNLIKDSSVVCGGGAAEISCSIFLQQQSLNFSTLEQLIFQAFAEALDSIPTALAENSGLYPLQTLAELKASHQPTLGVDCLGTGNNDMLAQGVVEGLQAKKHQLVMATQLANTVLKIDDVRGPKDTINK